MLNGKILSFPNNRLNIDFIRAKQDSKSDEKMYNYV